MKVFLSCFAGQFIKIKDSEKNEIVTFETDYPREDMKSMKNLLDYLKVDYEAEEVQ